MNFSGQVWAGDWTDCCVSVSVYASVLWIIIMIGSLMQGHLPRRQLLVKYNLLQFSDVALAVRYVHRHAVALDMLYFNMNTNLTMYSFIVHC